MPQTNQPPTGANQTGPITSMAFRSAQQMFDLNLSVARVLWRTQAKTAAAFGMPDLSPLFDTADDGARRVLNAGTEQLLSTAQRANDAAVELQRQVGRVLETQTTQAAQTLQHGLEEFGQQAAEGLTQLCETARQTAEEAERSAEELAQQTLESIRRAGEQQREGLQRASEQQREGVQRTGEQFRSGAAEAGAAANKDKAKT
jgi:DNA anti-recombination protein RmuC